METPPPLPAFAAAERPRFNLALAAWLAWGLYALVCVGLFLVHKGPADLRDLGELCGRIVATLLFPVLLAWLAWRIAQRSASAGNVTFFVVFVLCVFGQVSTVLRKAQANAELGRIRAETQALQTEERAAAAKGQSLDPGKAQKVLSQTSEQLGIIAENSTGRERLLNAAAKDYMDQLIVATQHYSTALKSIGAENLWDLHHFVPGPPAAARRKAIAAFAQANAELGAFQDPEGRGLSRVLEAHGARPAEVASTLAGYKKSAGTQLPRMAKIRETDDRIAKAMLDFVDFAEANYGKWQFTAEGKIVFSKPGAVTTYNEILGRVRAASAEQAALKK